MELGGGGVCRLVRRPFWKHLPWAFAVELARVLEGNVQARTGSHYKGASLCALTFLHSWTGCQLLRVTPCPRLQEAFTCRHWTCGHIIPRVLGTLPIPRGFLKEPEWHDW